MVWMDRQVWTGLVGRGLCLHSASLCALFLHHHVLYPTPPSPHLPTYPTYHLSCLLSLPTNLPCLCCMKHFGSWQAFVCLTSSSLRHDMQCHMLHELGIHTCQPLARTHTHTRYPMTSLSPHSIPIPPLPLPSPLPALPHTHILHLTDDITSDPPGGGAWYCGNCVMFDIVTF